MNISMDLIYYFEGKEVKVKNGSKDSMKVIEMDNIKLFVEYVEDRFVVRAIPIRMKEVDVLVDENGYLQKSFDRKVSLKFNTGFLEGHVFTSEKDAFCFDWSLNSSRSTVKENKATIELKGTLMHMTCIEGNLSVLFRFRPDHEHL